jgi:hypothetical protein
MARFARGVRDENADDLPEISWTVLRQIAGGMPSQWDRHTKRAAALADALLLTPTSRRLNRVGKDDDDKPALSIVDQLAAKRAERAS